MRPYLALAGALALAAVTGCKPAPDQATTGTGQPAIGGPFQLTDQNGRTVTEAALKGKPSLVFFGYTYCPEVCPTTLTAMSRWLKALGQDGDKLTIFYVTIDPQRDTAKQLKQYLTAFDPRIHGLTGTPAQVARIAKEYRVYYARSPLPNGDYEMDHSTTTYMMDRDGRFVGAIGYGEKDEAVLPLLRDLIAGRTPSMRAGSADAGAGEQPTS